MALQIFVEADLPSFKNIFAFQEIILLEPSAWVSNLPLFFQVTNSSGISGDLTM